MAEQNYRLMKQLEGAERKYEAPKIIKKEKMTFPIDILNNLGIGQVCKQCSSCHNCR